MATIDTGIDQLMRTSLTTVFKRKMSSSNCVQVLVGGVSYSIAISDIEKHPGCFFESMIKKEWAQVDGKPVEINRDGSVFKFVYAYMVCGQLPRNKNGDLEMDDETLATLTSEADFYGLEYLVQECKIQNRRNMSELEGFLSIKNYIAKSVHQTDKDVTIKTNSDCNSDLASGILSLTAPFCLTGKVWHHTTKTFYKSSSMQKLNVAELIADATQSPYGHGMETVIDTAVRNSFEISADKLDAETLRQLQRNLYVHQLAPHLQLELRPYKLVIYQKGGHFDEHRDTVRGAGHIGTLVLILNSEYTGGELEVSHGGRTEVVTGSKQWVAMYGDCLHKIKPVISGTRVSLIFDIYGREHTQQVRNEDDHEFWDARSFNPALTKRFIGAKPESVARLQTGLEEELNQYDNVILCLQHLYPEYQTSSPSYLKGGDRALYDVLVEHYEVKVVTITIHRVGMEGEGFIINCSLYAPPSSATDNTFTDSSQWSEPAIKKQFVNTKKSLVVLVNPPDSAGLLEYTPFIEYTGNEAQLESSFYLIVGLQVQRKRAD